MASRAKRIEWYNTKLDKGIRVAVHELRAGKYAGSFHGNLRCSVAAPMCLVGAAVWTLRDLRKSEHWALNVGKRRGHCLVGRTWPPRAGWASVSSSVFRVRQIGFEECFYELC